MHEIVSTVRAEEYGRGVANLRAFLNAFNDLVRELQPSHGDGTFPRWEPRTGREAEAARLAGEVARLAVPAAEAFDASRQWIDYKRPGTWQTQPVNPALVWSSIFDEMPMLDPRLLNIVGQQALGSLESKQREQAARQRGLIGALGRFFTLAPRVRQAAGLPPHSGRGNLVTGAVAFIQALIVALVAGVLVYPVANAFGWIP